MRMVYRLGSEGITGSHGIIVDYSSNICERATCTRMIPVHKRDDETTSESNLESRDERAKVVHGDEPGIVEGPNTLPFLHS